MMKYNRSLFLFSIGALVLCLLLSACAPKPANENPATSTEPTAEPALETTKPDDASGKAEELPEVIDIETTDPLAFTDNEALRSFLIGAWEYRLLENGEDSDPVLTLTLRDDASYRIEVKTDELAFDHEGVWAQTQVNAKDEEPMDGFHLSPSPRSDVICSGDFLLTGWASCDGDYLIHLSTLTGEPNVFSFCWSVYDATLRKQTDETAPAAVGEPKRDAHFFATCWKVAEDQSVMWLDDVEEQELNWISERHTAIPYVLRSDYEPRCGVDAFVRGGQVAEIYTNADGEITILNWGVLSYHE